MPDTNKRHLDNEVVIIFSLPMTNKRSYPGMNMLRCHYWFNNMPKYLYISAYMHFKELGVQCQCSANGFSLVENMTSPENDQRADARHFLATNKFPLLCRLSITSLAAMLITAALILLYRQDQLAEHEEGDEFAVALFINHEAHAEDILKWADMAMYQAKDAGRNQIRSYEPELRSRS